MIVIHLDLVSYYVNIWNFLKLVYLLESVLVSFRAFALYSSFRRILLLSCNDVIFIVHNEMEIIFPKQICIVTRIIIAILHKINLC